MNKASHPLPLHALVVLVVLAAIAGQAFGQPVPVTFKYVPRPNQPFERVFLPGTFNNWGPNSGGFIAPGAPSQMTYDADLDMYLYSWGGTVGTSAEYKIHLHLNASGSNYVWLGDPANPIVNPGNENNSVITVADPMLFQMDYRVDGQDRAVEVSAGLFSLAEFSEIMIAVNRDTVDGLPFFDSGNGILRYALPPEISTSNPLFEIMAVTVDGDTVSGKIGTLPVEVEDVPRPEGLEDGITYDPSDPARATLSLFAPGKNTVYVIGDFNDWTEDPDFLLKRDSLNADSMWFWIELTGLTPGMEYGFQYLIDGELRVGDPYSTKILDPVYDPALGDVYPGLKPYPADETTQIVSVLQTGKPVYEWRVPNFERPPATELVIYELLVRDFIDAHDFATMIDTLDYLERLGINAIELMPVAEFTGNSNWGYEPNFVFAADKYYGPENGLKAFIDACHERGIAVILDVVYNHNAYEAPFSRLYSTSAQGTPGAQPTPDNPWLNPVATHPFNVFNDMNHQSAATQYWLDRVNAYWLTEFNVDGFRFDLSKGFTQTVTGDDIGAWGQYDASRIALLKRMADRIWEIDSTAYITLEHFAVDSEERELAAHGMDRGRAGMFIWNKISDKYNEATMGFNTFGRSNFSQVYHGNRRPAWDFPNLISFMESHDEQWMMFKNIKYGACALDPEGGNDCAGEGTGYNTRHVPVALDRQKMVAAFFFTVPGPKLVWQFGELGYGYGPDGRDCLRPSNNPNDFGECPSGTPIRTGRKPIRWDYYDDPLRNKLYRTWSELLRLRKEHAVFRSADTEVEMAVGGAIKTMSFRHSEMDAVLIGNFAVTDSAGAVPFTSTGTWYSFFTGDSVNVTDPDSVFRLLPGEFHLFTSRRVQPAESGLITVSTTPTGLPDHPDLGSGIQLFPNPSREQAWLDFEMVTQGSVVIAVYDTLGRLVTKIDRGGLPPGRHREALDLSDLTAGVYFVQFESDDSVQVASLVVP